MPDTARGRRRPRWLTLGIGSIGATSLLSDTGHEMVTAILPGFITTVLGGSAAVLGIIEGFSDALTGLAKLAGGPLADDPERRRAMASGGYTVTALATGAIGLTAAAWQAGILRGVSWAARGFRSPARDSMLATLAVDGATGRAYGVERAGDNLGAVLGPLLGGALATWIGLRPTIWVSVVPGLLAALAIGIAARQARRLAGDAPRLKAGLREGYRRLRGTGLLRTLIPIALFEGGNLAATLLILRANRLLVAEGLPLAAAIALTTVLYACYNAAAALLSIPAGALVDRIGGRVVLALGALAYLAAYLGLALTPPVWGLVLLFFVLGGIGIGLGETAESTLVAHQVPDRLRGSGFGMLGLVQAGGDLSATVVGGAIYTAAGPVACFCYAAVWMVAALATALTIRPRRRPHAVS